jgi:oligopeptide transport system substrate-binding protein
MLPMARRRSTRHTMRNMRRLLSIFAAILCLCMIVSYLSWRSPRSDEPIIALSLPRTIDPCMATRLDEFRLISALFEPLVRLDAKTLTLQPALAQRWSSNDDHREWIFQLNPTARWSDGKNVTAHDMRRGILRHIITQSPNAFYIEKLIRGALNTEADLATRRQQLEQQIGISCSDEHTLSFSLTHPAPHFPIIIALSAFVPLTAEQDQDNDHARLIWTKAKNIVGNGPFRVSAAIPRHSFSLIPSDTYTGPHPADGPLHIAIVDSPGTALRQYFSGEIDALLLLPADAVADIKRHKIPGLLQAPSLNTMFWRVRLVPRPDDNPRVTAALQHPLLRRALATSMERTQICSHLLNENASPATTFVPPIIEQYLPYHPPLTTLRDNLEQAKRDIAQVRAELGEIPELEMVVPNQPAERQTIGEFIRDRWQRELGLRLRFTILPQTELRSREQNIDYDISFAVWLGDFLDPITFLDCFVTDGGANRTGYAEPRYNNLLTTATQHGGRERFIFLQNAEQQLVNDIPLIPIGHNACSFLVRPNIHGITANALEMVYFDEISRELNAASDK